MGRHRVNDALRAGLASVAGVRSLKACAPPWLTRLSRRLRVRLWLRGAYRNHLEVQARHGRRVIHFLHISKTGGTAIMSALKDRLFNDRSYVLITPHPFKLKDVPVGQPFAFVLRDPVRRFVSAFKHRKAEGRPAYHDPWTGGERKAFSWFPTPNDLGLALASKDEATRRRAEWAMDHIALLDTPYTFWLGSKTYLESRMEDLLFVGFQESLDEDFERFLSLADYPEMFVLPREGQAANRTGSEKEVLCPEAEAALRDWYAEDYKIYAHCRDHILVGTESAGV